jgi:hypothetical protein
METSLTHVNAIPRGGFWVFRATQIETICKVLHARVELGLAKSGLPKFLTGQCLANICKLSSQVSAETNCAHFDQSMPSA